MTSTNEYKQFAAVSLELSRRAADPAEKTHRLILAEAWLNLAARTVPLVERETGEARRLLEQPMSRAAVQGGNSEHG